MRTISKRTQYGLKAMQILARRYREGPVMIGSIAREESIPVKFLEAILLDLKSHGLLESKLGRKGGYRLSRPPSSMTGTVGEKPPPMSLIRVNGVARVSNGSPLWASAIFAFQQCGLNRRLSSRAQRS